MSNCLFCRHCKIGRSGFRSSCQLVHPSVTTYCSTGCYPWDCAYCSGSFTELKGKCPLMSCKDFEKDYGENTHPLCPHASCEPNMRSFDPKSGKFCNCGLYVHRVVHEPEGSCYHFSGKECTRFELHEKAAERILDVSLERYRFIGPLEDAIGRFPEGEGKDNRDHTVREIVFELFTPDNIAIYCRDRRGRILGSVTRELNQVLAAYDIAIAVHSRRGRTEVGYHWIGDHSYELSRMKELPAMVFHTVKEVK